VRLPAFAKPERKGKKCVAKHRAKPLPDSACLRTWSSRLQPDGEQRPCFRRLFTKAVNPLYNTLAAFVNDRRDDGRTCPLAQLVREAAQAALADTEIGELPATMRRAVAEQVAQACETSKRQEEKANHAHDLWQQDGAPSPRARPLSPCNLRR
jgi:hypothetical protein